MKRSELKSYPPPSFMVDALSAIMIDGQRYKSKGNPACVCTHAMQAMFCQTGHMLECHYPMDCLEAKCSHLAKYDFDFEEDQ